MPTLVILHHVTKNGEHWDLMLEQPTALRTWRLADNPLSIQTTWPIPATQLPDHRAIYLDYEGPLSGDRGHVTRILRATFEYAGPISSSFVSIYITAPLHIPPLSTSWILHHQHGEDWLLQQSGLQSPPLTA